MYAGHCDVKSIGWCLCVCLFAFKWELQLGPSVVKLTVTNVHDPSIVLCFGNTAQKSVNPLVGRFDVFADISL